MPAQLEHKNTGFYWFAPIESLIAVTVTAVFGNGSIAGDGHNGRVACKLGGRCPPLVLDMLVGIAHPTRSAMESALPFPRAQACQQISHHALGLAHEL